MQEAVISFGMKQVYRKTPVCMIPESLTFFPTTDLEKQMSFLVCHTCGPLAPTAHPAWGAAGQVTVWVGVTRMWGTFIIQKSVATDYL